MAEADGLWRLRVICDISLVPAVDEALEPFGHSASSFEIDGGPLWRVDSFLNEEPDLSHIAEALGVVSRAFGVKAMHVACDKLEQRDWVADSLKNFPALEIGRFYVHGSHITGPLPLGLIPLKLDAGAAFGTGDHATTTGCLIALQKLWQRGGKSRILDMGTGTGILAMGAAKLWPGASIMAADIDPVSVRVAENNLRDNGLDRAVRAICSKGFTAPAVRGAGPYDLIVANILARPLVGLAGDMASAIIPGGHAVLSGLLVRDGQLVLSAYQARGFQLKAKIDIGEWRTMILRAPRIRS